MATIYKFKDSTIEPLVARLHADEIEVYSGHELEGCIRYQWKLDHLDGNIIDAPGDSTGKSYQVDTSSVGNSGEYYCEIQVGNTGDCDQVTQRRRVTIVECIPGDIVVKATGGGEQAEVRAPHYENPVWDNGGVSWISPTSGMIPCPVGGTTNVCLFVQNYNIDPAPNNDARQAQPSITVGELVCFYGVGQDFPETADAGKEEDPPAAGPFINLSNDGPSLAVGDGIGTPITFTADVGTVGGTGSETYTVAWTDDFGGSGTGLTYEVTNPGPIGPPPGMANPVTVTATVTSSADGSPTATASQIADFYTLSFLFPDPPSVMGDTYGFVNWLDWGGDPGTRTASGTFTTAGSGNWDASFTLLEGFIDTRSATLTYSLNGPGISINNETLTISGESTARRDISYTGMSGVYTWEIEISGVDPSNISRANGSALFSARFF